jgi:uncharacterized protein YwqG
VKKVKAIMEANKRPSVQCDLKYGKTDLKGVSKIGGIPDVAADFVWPKWNDSSLQFLAQIRLDEVTAIFPAHDLPKTGMIYFFYNRNQETWGFDPKDIGSWKVIYRSAIENLERAQVPSDIPEDLLFKEARITYREIPSYPSWESSVVSSLSDKEQDLYNELTSPEGSIHKLFGFADPIQSSEMELECQLASHGINTGSPEGYQDPRVKELEAGAKDWKLLMQIDSDDSLNMMWGDVGRLYFWYRKTDGKIDFDNIWMILQCS